MYVQREGDDFYSWDLKLNLIEVIRTYAFKIFNMLFFFFSKAPTEPGSLSVPPPPLIVSPVPGMLPETW